MAGKVASESHFLVVVVCCQVVNWGYYYRVKSKSLLNMSFASIESLSMTLPSD